MDEEQKPNGEAERLVNHPIIKQILDELEKNAIEIVVNTDDSNNRAKHVFEVRAVRNLREKLNSLAKGSTNRAQTKSVA